MLTKTDDFDAEGSIRKIEEDNRGVRFYEKVQESVLKSVDVQKAIKAIVWDLFKEKIGWVIAGATSLVIIEAFRNLLMKLIEKV